MFSGCNCICCLFRADSISSPNMYVCLLARSRYPLQDEWEDLTKLDRIMQYLPKRYRPKKDLHSIVSNIHSSARLAAELQDVFKDEEGQGEVIKTAEDLAEEARLKEASLKKEQVGACFMVYVWGGCA